MLKLFASSLFLRAVGFGVNYLFLLLIQRNYGVEEWGNFTIFFTYTQIISSFGIFGVQASSIKVFTDKNYGLKGSYRMIFLFITLTTSISLIFFSTLYFVLDLNIKLRVYHAILVTVPAYVLSFYNASFLRSVNRNSWFIFFESTGRFLLSSFIIALFFISSFEIPDPAIYAFQYGLCALVLMSQIVVLYHLKTVNDCGRPSINMLSFAKMSSYFVISIPLNRAAVYWISSLVLSFHFAPRIVGLYDTYFRLASLLNLLSFSVLSYTSPKISAFYNNRNEKALRRLCFSTSRILFITSFVSCVFVVFFGEWAVSYLDETINFEPLILSLLLCGFLVNTLVSLPGSMLQMTNYHKEFNQIMIILTILALLTNYILVVEFSYFGAAVATVIILVVKSALIVRIARKKFGFSGVLFLK